MRATDFEFRHRLFIIMALFVGGFWCYSFDPVNMATMFAERLMGHPIEPSALGDRHVLQAILALFRLHKLGGVGPFRK